MTVQAVRVRMPDGILPAEAMAVIGEQPSRVGPARLWVGELRTVDDQPLAVQQHEHDPYRYVRYVAAGPDGADKVLRGIVGEVRSAIAAATVPPRSGAR